MTYLFDLPNFLNHMVLSWLLNSIDGDLASHVIYAETASEVWANLKEQFEQSNAPRILQIRRMIYTHMQEQTSVVAYFNKLKAY